MKRLSLAFLLLAACVAEPVDGADKPGGGGGKADDPAACDATWSTVFEGMRVHSVLADGADLYVAAEGSIEKVSPEGELEQVIRSANAGFDGLQIAGDWLWWDTEVHASRAPKAGGPVELVSTDSHRAMFVDATHLYTASTRDHIRRFPLDADGLPDLESPEVLGEGTTPWKLVADATHVYWLDDEWYELAIVDKATGTTTLVDDLPGSYQTTSRELAASSRYVFWVAQEYDFQEIARFDKTTGETSIIATGAEGELMSQLRADERGVYWRPDPQTIRGVAHAGGAVTSLTIPAAAPFAMSLAGDHIYVPASQTQTLRVATCALVR